MQRYAAATSSSSSSNKLGVFEPTRAEDESTTTTTLTTLSAAEVAPHSPSPLDSCSGPFLLLPDAGADVFADLDASLECMFGPELSAPSTTDHCYDSSDDFRTTPQCWPPAGQLLQPQQEYPRQQQQQQQVYFRQQQQQEAERQHHYRPNSSYMSLATASRGTDRQHSTGATSSWHAHTPTPHYQPGGAAAAGAHASVTTIPGDACCCCTGSCALPPLPQGPVCSPLPQAAAEAVATNAAGKPALQAGQQQPRERRLQLQHLQQQHQQLQAMLARTEQLRASLQQAASPEEAAALARMVLGA